MHPTESQPDSTQAPNPIPPNLPTARAATELNDTDFLTETAQLIQTARQAAARSVNTVMTATYWEISQTPSDQSGMTELMEQFPFPWSHDETEAPS